MHQLLPVEIATRDRVGTVKGGKNVIIDEDGTMSVEIADVGGDLEEIKRLLGMSGSGEAPDKVGTSVWSRVMYLLGLEIGEKSDAANDKGSLWARVKYLLGLNIGKETEGSNSTGSLWARVKYLLECCEEIKNKPGGPTTGDLGKLETRINDLEKLIKELKTRVENVESKFDKYVTLETYNAKVGQLDAAIKAIVEKIYGGTYKDGNVSFTVDGKVAVGNMNVYGGDKNWIKTRKDGLDNDVKVV